MVKFNFDMPKGRDARNLMVIAKAVERGFEFDDADCLGDVVNQAEDYLMQDADTPVVMEQCDLSTHQNGQYYQWCDEMTDYDCSGDIIDFRGHYLAKDKVYFRFDEEGKPIWLDWFDFNRDTDQIVFDTIIDCNGSLVMLYC